jgi:hypothetical protein
MTRPNESNLVNLAHSTGPKTGRAVNFMGHRPILFLASVYLSNRLKEAASGE